MIIKTYREYFKEEETEILIITSKKKYINIAKKKIVELRKIIKNYILYNSYFQNSTKPLPLDLKSNKIIRKMMIAGLKTNTGPMSSIAGCIANEVTRYVKSKGCNFIIIDNGGDIAIYNYVPKNNIILKIYTGTSYFKNIGLLLEPKKKIIGICTSSATIGSSLSFGSADSVTIISNNTTLADSAATMICNSVKLKSKSNILKALNNFQLVKGLLGIIIIKDDYIGMKGKVPKIINIKNEFI